MNNKRFFAVLTATVTLLLAGLALTSCGKTDGLTGELGNYTLQLVCDDPASQDKAKSVLSKMQSVMRQSTGTGNQYNRMDMIIVGVLNPVHSNNKTAGNFVITLYWNSVVTEESVFVHRMTFSTSGN